MEAKKLSRTVNMTLAVFIAAITVIFAFSMQFIYAFETLFILFIILLYSHFEKQKKIYIDNYIKILVTLDIFAHIYIGELLNIYDNSFVFDKCLHLFGTFGFTLLAYALLRNTVYNGIGSKMFKFILIASVGITIGTLFEMVEFTCDTFLGTYSQKGLLDTDLDMLFNIIGSSLAALFMNYRGETIE